MLAFDHRSAPQDDDVVDLLHESHENIRSFLDLGRRLAQPPPAQAAEVRSLAGIIQRYSVVGLRLLIADEEALVPYLAGHSPKLDRAIVRMRTDHAEYSEHVDRLVALCRVLEHAPERPDSGRELGQAITAMAACLEPHLALVEREILSALDALAPNERVQIRYGMEARRERAQRSDW